MQAGNLSPWTVPERCGGRVLRVTGTDPPRVPCPALPTHLCLHALCSLLPLTSRRAPGLSAQCWWGQLCCWPWAWRPYLRGSEPLQRTPSPAAGAPAPRVTSQRGDRHPAPVHACTWCLGSGVRVRVSEHPGLRPAGPALMPPCVSGSARGCVQMSVQAPPSHPHMVPCMPAWGPGCCPLSPAPAACPQNDMALGTCCSSFRHALRGRPMGTHNLLLGQEFYEGSWGPGDIVPPDVGTVVWGVWLLELPGVSRVSVWLLGHPARLLPLAHGTCLGLRPHRLWASGPSYTAWLSHTSPPCVFLVSTHSRMCTKRGPHASSWMRGGQDVPAVPSPRPLSLPL